MPTRTDKNTAAFLNRCWPGGSSWSRSGSAQLEVSRFLPLCGGHLCRAASAAPRPPWRRVMIAKCRRGSFWASTPSRRRLRASPS